MLYKGIFITAASGKIDGAVASHNRGGPYFRALTIPTDPDTAEQEALRTTMSELAASWKTDVSPDQRSAWARFAASHTYPNRIGDQRQISGRNDFFRANIVRGQIGHWLGDTYPYVFDPSPVGPSCPGSPSFVAQVGNLATGEIDLSWDDTEEWSTEEGAALVWYMSPPQGLTINYYRSPFTLYAAVNQSMNGTNNVTIPSLAPIPAAHRLFYRFRVSRADGRLSTPQHGILDT